MNSLLQSRIVDAHIHVWTPDTKKYPLAPGFTKDDFWLPTFTPKEHFEFSNSIGPVRINLVQMTWYGLDHSYILDLIDSDPDTFVGTGIVPAFSDVSLPSPDEAMIELSKGGIYAFRVRAKGARVEIPNEQQWLNYEGYDKMFAAASEHNLALSFMINHPQFPELSRMCNKFPNAPIILDHVGGVRIRDGVFPEMALNKLCEMAKHKNIMVKLGPFQALGDKKSPYFDLLPVIKRIVEAFGPERCMWESDCGGPIFVELLPSSNMKQDYPAAIDLIRQHSDFLSQSDIDYILFKTAENFFFKR